MKISHLSMKMKMMSFDEDLTPHNMKSLRNLT